MMDTLEHKEPTWFWSNKIIFELPIDNNAKLVYIFLCRISGKSHTAYPSYSTIKKKCSIKSSTTIKKAIDALMAAGLLDYRTRTSKDGDKGSNVYTLYDEPNEKVIRKFHALNNSDFKKCSALNTNKGDTSDGLPNSEFGQGSPLNEQPYPPDEQPPTNNGLPPVQNLDYPIPLNGHNQSLSNSRSFKNQSINRDGQTDAHELQNFFESVGVYQLEHTAQIPLVKAVLSDLLQTGRVGKAVYPEDEMAAILKTLTSEKIDAALDRYAGQAQKRKIPSPFEYIKTCVFTAGREKFNSAQEVLPHNNGRVPTYDMDEYTRLSMERLMGDQKEGDQKCPV